MVEMPAVTTGMECGSRPFCRSRYFTSWSVEEPGAVTPTGLPTRSFIVRLCTNRVFVKTGHHVHRSAHHRGQRFRSPAQIGNGYLQPFIFEVPEPVGERQRQID